MSNGLILTSDDVKRILAEKFGVTESDVIRSQYSWIIVQKEAADGLQGEQNGS